MKKEEKIKMPEKRKKRRPVAENILAILEEHKGVGLRFSDIKMEMLKKGMMPVDCSLSQNNHWLVQHGLIAKVGSYYGIPAEHEDGKTYIKIPDQEPTEVWKVRKE